MFCTGSLINAFYRYNLRDDLGIALFCGSKIIGNNWIVALETILTDIQQNNYVIKTSLEKGP